MCVYVRECVCMHVYVRECVCVSERLRVYVSVWKSVWGKASVGGVWDDFSIQLFLACCSRPRTCRKKGGWKTHWKSHDATLAHTPCFKAVVILKHIIYWTCSKCRFVLFCIFTDILKCYVDDWGELSLFVLQFKIALIALQPQVQFGTLKFSETHEAHPALRICRRDL